jgi:hypothetical protein
LELQRREGQMGSTQQQLVFTQQRREWQAVYMPRPSRPVGRPCPIRTAFAAGASTIARWVGRREGEAVEVGGKRRRQ